MRDKTTVLICLIQEEERWILDVGCGEGAISQRLQSLGKQVVGIEKDAEKAKKARAFCQSVIVGDIESAATFESLHSLGYLYDAIVCSEVLEHCTDPAAVLKQLKPFLKAQVPSWP